VWASPNLCVLHGWLRHRQKRASAPRAAKPCLMCLPPLPSQAQAQWLPPMVFSCEKSKKSDKGGGGGSPLPGPTDECSKVTCPRKCGRRSGCVWCKGMITEGQCFSEVRGGLGGGGWWGRGGGVAALVEIVWHLQTYIWGCEQRGPPRPT
jgi:hypothetical protein